MLTAALSGQRNPDVFLKWFGFVFLIVFGCYLARAFVTGSVKLKGEEEPRRRKDKPQEFKEAMGILTVIFIIISSVFVWMFLISK